MESANRKVYMLFDLEPAQAVTGGAWYTDQSLDQEFIERARDICLQLIERSNGSMSVEQITSEYGTGA